jgi:nicotinamidase-related amidase
MNLLSTAPLRIVLVLLTLATSGHALAQGASASEATAPGKSALLVIDAQTGVLAPVWESKRVSDNIESLVAKARASNVPVIWVQHSDEELKYGSEGWKLAPRFAPTPGESVVHKKYNSSFAETDLDLRLKALGVSRLVIAGAATNWCVRATAYAAVDRGYDLLLVSDAHSTESLDFGNGKVIPAEMIVAEFNTAIKWLSVPKVRTEVRKTSEVAF